MSTIECHYNDISHKINVDETTSLNALLTIISDLFAVKNPQISKYSDSYGALFFISKNSLFDLQTQLSSTHRDHLINLYIVDERKRKRSSSESHRYEVYDYGEPLAKSDPSITPAWREYEPIMEFEEDGSLTGSGFERMGRGVSSDVLDTGVLKPYETAMFSSSSWDDLRIDTDLEDQTAMEFGRVTPTTPIIKTPPSDSPFNSHLSFNTDYDLPSFHRDPSPHIVSPSFRSPSFNIPRPKKNDLIKDDSKYMKSYSATQPTPIDHLDFVKRSHSTDTFQTDFEKDTSSDFVSEDVSSAEDSSSHSNSSDFDSEESDEDKWEPSKWRKCRKLVDRGASGSVYEGLIKNGQIVAVKQMDIPKDNQSPQIQAQIDTFRKEVDVLKTLKHPHIVRYLGCYFHVEYIYIFLEFVPGGSIRTLMGKFGPLDERLMKLYCSQILKGLNYLHSQRVIHRDIKCGNILVDTQGNAKLADFGCAKILNDLISQVHSLLGTPFWMAPEVLMEQGHDFSADIWSFGCTMIEMATGDIPYTSKKYTHVHAFILDLCTKQIKPDIPEHLSIAAKIFIELTLTWSPEERPDTYSLMRNQWLKVKRRKVKKKNMAQKLMAANTISLVSIDYTQLPSNIARRIFKNLDIHSLVNTSMVCLNWRSLYNQVGVWKSLSRKIWKKSSLVESKREFIKTYLNDLFWESKRFRELITFKPHRKILSMTMLQKSKRVVTSGSDKKVKIWDFINLGLDHRTKVKSQNVKATKQIHNLCSDENETVIVGCDDESIRIWNIKSKEEECVYAEHQETVNCLEIREQSIYSGSEDKTIKIFDMESLVIKRSLQHSSPITNLAVKETNILSTDRNNVIQLWDERSGKLERSFKYHKEEITSIVYMNDKILSSSNGIICEWDLRRRKPVSVMMEQGQIYSIKFDGFNHILASAEQGITSWDFNKETILWTEPSPKSAKPTSSLSCDWASNVCIQSYEKSVTVYQLNN